MSWIQIHSIVEKVLVFILSTILLGSCGGPSFEKKPHRVTNIIDGNTIEVDNNVKIGLIAINNTRESEIFLKTNLLNQQIRFVYDSGKRDPVTNFNTKIFGYIATLNINRLSVNAEILKQRLSGLNLDFLTDSLEAFKIYSGESVITHNSVPTGVTNQQSYPDPAQSQNGSRAFVDLVSKTKYAVFTIYQQNSDGDISGLGTGFFISGEGIGVSNYHVFKGGSSFIVKTFDERQFSVGQVLAEDQQSDFIIFKIDGNNYNLPFLQFNNDLPQQGEEIFVIGNPSGLENTVTRGIISAIRSRYSANDLIQIDAAISPGSSGSPVCGMNGNVVGIATFKILIEGCESCNFAINAEIIRNILGNSNN